jgi:putative phosphoesterase
MNAPIKAQKCQPDISYCKFGAQSLLKLLSVFEDQIAGIIKNDDIEYVHKTRVTSRRLRATLPLFRGCFHKKEYKLWICEIKKVTCLLGNARDLDVQIIFVQLYREKLDSATEKAFIDILIKSHRERRKSVQPLVEVGLEELKATDVLEDLHQSCEQIIKEKATEVFNPQKVLEKARWHIFFRLDAFLAMEKYVQMENEILKHHEMRICAKKLRYTMESFASLYQNKLTQEIETTKTFQDILGEMHDCDVWIEYVPKFLQETILKMKSKQKKIADTTKIEKALINFLSFVKEKRKENYKEFVHFWEENKKRGFFVQLAKTINDETTERDEEKTKQVLAKPDVKIAIISDVHANLQALETVIADAEAREVDVFINAGDSIGFGPCPNEVVKLLLEKNVLSILGNYDLEVIEGKIKTKGEKNLALKFVRKELAKSCECYLFSLPRELRFEAAGKKLLVTHGSPESIEEHIYNDTPIERLKLLADIAKAEVVIVGHSHEQFRKKANGVWFVNPGSVGRPSDGNPQAAYGILSFNPFRVELIRLDYDVERAAGALRRKGLPESFSQMLLRGASLDAIIKEDRFKDLMVQDCDKMVQVSGEISKKYWPDTEHYGQVSKLALSLFDGLINLHNLGMRERCWLECAAILHDIGLVKSRSSHHKRSAKLILNETKLPYTSQERRIIASVARYHRKALPELNDYNLSTLDRTTIQKVKMLSSLLRLADGLDYTHQTIVETLNVKVSTKRITVECVSKRRSMLEEQAFNKKKDLFEKVFAKKMVLTWKQPLKPLDM